MGYVKKVFWIFFLSLLESCSTEHPLEVVPAPSEVRVRALSYARRYMEEGTGYQWGGQDPLQKIVVDCSGLLIRCYQYACQDEGYFLLFHDTTSYGLWEYCKELDLEDVSPGDLIFMGENGRIFHVALFIRKDAGFVTFIDSTFKPEEGINGVSERSYSLEDSRILAYGRLSVGRK
mgnify:CR=1 FL=1